jgi:dolichol-phosphate mannosyltransferase
VSGLSIILPVKYPEPHLKTLVTRIHYLLQRHVNYEILIQKEKGLTTAVLAGVVRSQYPVILVMDADGQHDPRYILPMYHLIERVNYDLAIGYKLKDENPRYRQLISMLFRRLATLLGFHAKDPMSGFVCGKKVFFKRLCPSMSPKFVLQLLNMNLKICDQPIIFHKRRRGASKMRVQHALIILKDMVKIKYITRN